MNSSIYSLPHPTPSGYTAAKGGGGGVRLNSKWFIVAGMLSLRPALTIQQELDGIGKAHFDPLPGTDNKSG